MDFSAERRGSQISLKQNDSKSLTNQTLGDLRLFAKMTNLFPKKVVKHGDESHGRIRNKIPEKQIQEDYSEQFHITGINKKTSVTCGHPNLQNIFHMEIPIRESYSL